MTEQLVQLVYVRRQPNDWREAAYRVEDIEGIHRSSVTGGIGANLSHFALCGYVWCDGMVRGELAHSCRHGPPPHRIKVVIPKICNDPKLWAELAGEDYHEPKPLDMSPDAVSKRRDRASRAAQTRAANRKTRVDALAADVSRKWPTGRMPSAATIAERFNVPMAVARDARRKAVEARSTAKTGHTFSINKLARGDYPWAGER